MVRVHGRASAPLEVRVYPVPRIHRIAPDIGVAGDEIKISGSGWTLSATVRFGGIEAPVIDAGFKLLRVRVPPLRAGPGSSVPVVVFVGKAASQPVRFKVGRPRGRVSVLTRPGLDRALRRE
jgi:hypothetical protein